jgi:hypothetical protein
MKITKKIAAATLVPAAAAGIAVSSLAVASAADAPSGHAHAAKGHDKPEADQRLAARGAAHKVFAHKAPGHKVPAHKVRLQARPDAQQKASQAAANSVNHAKHAKVHHAAHAKHTSMFAGMSAFERCVAWRESGNNPTASSAGMFGILPSTWASLGYPGTAGTSSVALQKQAFDRLYAQYGTSPWAPYDGC